MPKSYPEHMNVTGEIGACVDMLNEQYGSCTISDVLQFLRYESTPEMLAIVVEIAVSRGYRIKKVSEGYRIHDW